MTQLIEAVAKNGEMTKAEATKSVNLVLGAIADNLTEGDGDISVIDFGRFSVKHVPERKGINPATKEQITIEAHDKIVFKASDNISVFSRKHC